MLKSLNPPLGGWGSGRLGAVASQMIFDRLRSTGAMVIAIRKIAINARANISSMPNEMRIASKMTGITASICSVVEQNMPSLYTWNMEIESGDSTLMCRQTI